ncbi:hypothetical protein CCP3SC5AM1_320016 [Gammaproteobacteria bacterium]
MIALFLLVVIHLADHNDFFFSNVWAGNSNEIPGVLGLSRGGDDSSQIYAITGESGALYRSTDGAAWVKVTINLSNVSTYFSAVTLTPKGTVYVSSSEGLFRSTDSGRSWSVIPTEEQIFFVFPVTDDILLARIWKTGLLRSENGGTTWYPVGIELQNPVLSVVQDKAGLIWAATFGGGIYRSTDKGVTWEAFGLEQGYIITLAIHEGILYAGTYKDGVYRYNSNGWEKNDYGLPARATVQLLSATPEGLVASIDQQGLYLRRTGENWHLITDGLRRIDEVTGILPIKDGNWLVATRPQGLFRVNPITNLWVSVPFQVNVRTVATDHQGGAYVVLANGQMLHGILAQSDGTDSTFEYFGQAPASSEIIFITRNGEILAGGKQGLEIKSFSKKKLQNWRTVNLARTVPEISCLTETETNLVVGARNLGLLRSADGGVTWSLSKNGLIRACVAAGGYLYVATATGLSVSDNDGLSWTDYPLSPAPLALAADGERGVILIQNEIVTSRKTKPRLMESTTGTAPVPLYLNENEGTGLNVQALTISGDILYLASTNGVELFKRDKAVWSWKGQILSRITVTALTSLHEGRAMAATDRGLFVLNGLDDAIQIPITP